MARSARKMLQAKVLLQPRFQVRAMAQARQGARERLQAKARLQQRFQVGARASGAREVRLQRFQRRAVAVAQPKARLQQRQAEKRTRAAKAKKARARQDRKARARQDWLHSLAARRRKQLRPQVPTHKQRPQVLTHKQRPQRMRQKRRRRLEREWDPPSWMSRCGSTSNGWEF